MSYAESQLSIIPQTDAAWGGGPNKNESTDQLIRRANELLKEQAILLAELQKLKLEVLKRNRETLELHQHFVKRHKRE